MGTVLEKKQDNLIETLGKYTQEGLLVAYSGGVDSSFLLWAAQQACKKYGGKIKGITAASASLAKQEHIDIEKFIHLIQAPHTWITSNEITNPLYIQNDKNRCYYCKSELFTQMTKIAKESNFTYIAYGYNLSDEGDTRPGHTASLEYKIKSPLYDTGLTKEEIRQCLTQENLPFANKPATPCLSSRVTTGIEIKATQLEQLNQIEQLIKQQKIKTVRARLCKTNEGALFIRIEVEPKDMLLVLNIQKELTTMSLSFGYKWVTLDLQGYKLGGGTL